MSLHEERHIGDVDLKKCPRCGAHVSHNPYPSMHCASTFYNCGTHVLEIIGHREDTHIEHIGIVCGQEFAHHPVEELQEALDGLYSLLPKVDIDKCELDIGGQTYRFEKNQSEPIESMIVFFEVMTGLKRSPVPVEEQIQMELTKATAEQKQKHLDSLKERMMSWCPKKYTVDEVEINKAYEWLISHNCEADRPYVGEYSFSQTNGIGIGVTAVCVCGKTHDITNYDLW